MRIHQRESISGSLWRRGKQSRSCRAGWGDGVGFGEWRGERPGRSGAKTVAGEPDDALNEMEAGVDGVVEDDDVAAVDRGRGEEAEGTVRCAGRCELFVDEEEVADEEGGLHGFRGDAEGLRAERDDEDRDDDEVKERLHRGKNTGPVMRVGMRTVWFVWRWVGR
jgi:hypothetical protein